MLPVLTPVLLVLFTAVQELVGNLLEAFVAEEQSTQHQQDGDQHR